MSLKSFFAGIFSPQNKPKTEEKIIIQPQIEATVKDIDGNVYHTIVIGKQVWMVENLKTGRYCNGNIIANVIDEKIWGSYDTGASCNYNNDPGNAATYGKLYNWYAVDDKRGLAPVGWHVPTDIEWETLIKYLGGYEKAGGKLKETGTAHWNGNTEETNESGFTALPGGKRCQYGSFSSLSESGEWWTSTYEGGGEAFCCSIHSKHSTVYSRRTNKKNGLSVRCIRDRVSFRELSQLIESGKKKVA